jgi:hypothetical protein
MIFCKDLLFVHVPKTGGASVSKYLLKVLPKPVYWTHPEAGETPSNPGVVHIRGVAHESLEEARDVIQEYGYDIAEIPLILAVLRNPYSLEVSRYAYLKKGYIWDRGNNQELALYEDFESFAIKSTDHGGPGMSLQTYFLLDGRMPENLRVIKMENLAEGVKEALRTVGIETTDDFPEENVSEHDPFLSYYTRAAEEAVYQRYKWVFDEGFYKRIDPSNFMFYEKIPSPEQRVPIVSSVRQIGRSYGLWHDSWVGSVLRFEVAVEKPINRITIEGRFQHEFEGGIELVLNVNEQQTVAAFSNDPFFRWSVPCSIKPNSTAEIELKPSAVFRPKKTGRFEDKRELSFLLHSFVFDYVPQHE